MTTLRKLGSAAFAAAVLVVVSVVFFGSSRNKDSIQASQANSGSAAGSVVFAAVGRVEGLSETTQVGAAADGILKAIYVKEDQVVKAGTLLGEIACDDLNAMLETAIAETDGARQARTRLLRGARDEEKRIAIERTAAARATFEEAESRLGRQRVLYKGGEISRAAYEQAVRDLGVAKADFQAAVRTQQFLAAPPLREETARADAEVLAAEGRIRAVQERIRKCSIWAPIDGTVLRVYVKPGESFSTIAPRPLFSLADASGRRIKAEVDERDFGKVVVGQDVIVQADGLSGKKLNGTVASVSAVMGRKSVYTGDPSDKTDRDILEAVIDLKDAPQSLPIGLRVTVQFLSGSLQNRNGAPESTESANATQ